MLKYPTGVAATEIVATTLSILYVAAAGTTSNETVAVLPHIYSFSYFRLLIPELGIRCCENVIFDAMYVEDDDRP